MHCPSPFRVPNDRHCSIVAGCSFVGQPIIDWLVAQGANLLLGIPQSMPRRCQVASLVGTLALSHPSSNPQPSFQDSVSSRRTAVYELTKARPVFRRDTPSRLRCRYPSADNQLSRSFSSLFCFSTQNVIIQQATTRTCPRQRSRFRIGLPTLR